MSQSLNKAALSLLFLALMAEIISWNTDPCGTHLPFTRATSASACAPASIRKARLTKWPRASRISQSGVPRWPKETLCKIKWQGTIFGRRCLGHLKGLERYKDGNKLQSMFRWVLFSVLKVDTGTGRTNNFEASHCKPVSSRGSMLLHMWTENPWRPSATSA